MQSSYIARPWAPLGSPEVGENGVVSSSVEPMKPMPARCLGDWGGLLFQESVKNQGNGGTASSFWKDETNGESNGESNLEQG